VVSLDPERFVPVVILLEFIVSFGMLRAPSTKNTG